MKKNFLKNYGLSISLLISIFIGSVLGIILKDKAEILKPFGDIFLNLLFTAVVPLVFFSISSAIAGMNDARRLGKILGAMMIVFVLTGIISSGIMVCAVKIFPPAVGHDIVLKPLSIENHQPFLSQMVRALTVTDFAEILSKKNMLALIIFAVIVGLATLWSKEKGRPFAQFLLSGNEVMTKVIELIMFAAPVGLGAYFAYLVGVFGPQLLGSYLSVVRVYYPVAFLYFFIAFSAYAFWAGGKKGFQTFWKNIIPPSLTALATGSSVATIPSNLEAAERTGVPKDISEMVIPIGSTIHMDGSCLSAVVKISLLFGLFHIDFSGPGTYLSAIGVALLSGIVMSGIPGGGFTGEIMIVTLYGFPIEALPVISMVGTLVDPPATAVNAVGDNVASMMVARMLGGKKWIDKKDGH